MGGREGEKLTTDREEALQPRDWTASSQHQPVSAENGAPDTRSETANGPFVHTLGV